MLMSYPRCIIFEIPDTVNDGIYYDFDWVFLEIPVKKWQWFTIVFFRRRIWGKGKVKVKMTLISQLWSIHWTLCWSSDPQVKEVWMIKERKNDKCNWSETQVTLECPRWNASARQVSRECPPRAGCRPKSHFYQIYFQFCSVICCMSLVVSHTCMFIILYYNYYYIFWHKSKTNSKRQVQLQNFATLFFSL